MSYQRSLRNECAKQRVASKPLTPSCLLVTHHSLPLSLFLKLFVFVVIVCEIVFLDNIQFDGIESDNFEFSPTLFA